MTFDGKMGAFEVLAGARYPIGLMEVYVVAGPGLGDREASPGTPAWRVLTGVSFGNGLNLVGAGGDVTAPTPTTIPSTPMPVASSGGDSGGTSTAGTSSTTTTTDTTFSGTTTAGGTGTGFTIPIPTGGIVIPSPDGTATGGTTTYGTGSSSYPTDYGAGSSTTTYGTGSSTYPTGGSTTTSGTGSSSTGSTYTTPTTPTPTPTPTQQQPSTYGGTNPMGPGMGGIQSWPTGMGTTSQPVSTDPNQQGTRNP
jgi:hypothetical protein